MPSITTVHESLPYIDPEPTPEERAAAEALISLERAAVADDPHHALLPPPASPNFTPAIQAELDRIAASPDDPTTTTTATTNNSNNNKKPTPLRAVDLARYEAPELADPAAAGRGELEPALSQAYTAMAYLGGRRQNLALLDTYGKNAWLVGNWHLEAELKALEREVAGARREIDLVTIRRQRVQEDVGGEIRGLEDTWRRGVGRVLETEIAAEGLRREILEAQRAQAEA